MSRVTRHGVKHVRSTEVKPQKTVVFIMGSGHCGSTLVDLVLGSHSEAFSLGELWELSRRVGDTKRHLRRCGVCGEDCPFWDDPALRRFLRRYFARPGVTGRLRRRLAPFVYDLYDELFKASDKNVLIDSSKNYRWIQRQLRPAYQWYDRRACLLYLVRDGRGVVNSYLRKYPDRGVAGWATEWARLVERMNGYYERFPEKDRIRVRYEDFATDTEAVVAKVTDRIGLRFEPDMLRYWIRDHHPVGGNLGTRSLVFRWRNRFPDLEQHTEGRSLQSHFEKSHYDQVGLAIRLDERWKKDLGEEQLRQFDEVAGHLNRELD